MHSTVNLGLIAPKTESNKEYRNKREKSKKPGSFDTQIKSKNIGAFVDKKEKISDSSIGYN